MKPLRLRRQAWILMVSGAIMGPQGPESPETLPREKENGA